MRPPKERKGNKKKKKNAKSEIVDLKI